MRTRSFKYLYGPVASRRLGRSLGVDLIPHKTCTYDCIYCQLGKTTNKTTARFEYVLFQDVLTELKEKLVMGLTCDYITIAGCGEPTLHSYIGELIENIKKLTKIPVAVLTNGSLLYLPEISDALMNADLVIPSLDAGDEELFQYVNRPHKDISYDQMVNGLINFTERFNGQVWLEVLLISGVTGMISETKKIAAWTEKIGATKIQLNTVNRPAAEDFACAVGREQMEKLAGLFPGVVEIIGDTGGTVFLEDSLRKATESDILSLLARRPCTLSGVCAGLGLHPNDAAKRLQQLVDNNLVKIIRSDHELFYKISGERG